MNYLSYELGDLQSGDVVVARIHGDSVNLRLMDRRNYSAYKSGRQHRYYGGHATSSPHRLKVPHGGSWILIVDRGGHSVNSTVSVTIERRATWLRTAG